MKATNKNKLMKPKPSEPEHPIRAVIVKNLERELNARKWSYSRLAKECGLPSPRISEIMTRRFEPRLGTLQKIADALGVKLFTLLIE